MDVLPPIVTQYDLNHISPFWAIGSPEWRVARSVNRNSALNRFPNTPANPTSPDHSPFIITDSLAEAPGGILCLRHQWRVDMAVRRVRAPHFYPTYTSSEIVVSSVKAGGSDC